MSARTVARTDREETKLFITQSLRGPGFFQPDRFAAATEPLVVNGMISGPWRRLQVGQVGSVGRNSHLGRRRRADRRLDLGGRERNAILESIIACGRGVKPAVQ